MNSNDSELKPASRCPSPRRVKPNELPDDSNPNELGPLELGLSSEGLGLESLTGSSNLGDFGDYTEAQLYDLNQQLLNESVPARPLIGTLEPLSALREEYENGSADFLRQIDWLSKHGYESIRRTRGDGDCFYRSLGFAYVESLLHSSDQELNVAQSISSIVATKETLMTQGIEALVFEDFLDEFAGLIESIVKPQGGSGPLTDEKLLDAFQNPEVSNAVVMYLRLLTSGHIRQNREQYEGFLSHPDTQEPLDVGSFCANFVEAMGKEADNVEISALCNALRLNLNVVYLNGRDLPSGVDVIEFRLDLNEQAKPLILLYRPGHYDVLQKV